MNRPTPWILTLVFTGALAGCGGRAFLGPRDVIDESPVDTGMAPVDTGTTVVDTGTVVVDTGVLPDTSVADAGDSGVPADAIDVLIADVEDVASPDVVVTDTSDDTTPTTDVPSVDVVDLDTTVVDVPGTDTQPEAAADVVPADGALVCGTRDPNVCNGSCVDTSNDPANCGACGMMCNLNQVCSAGSCRGTCATGTDCNRRCVDTMTDPDFCGGCAMACSSTQTCVTGVCM